jgi:Xaa-Pro aminopeptidase
MHGWGHSVFGRACAFLILDTGKEALRMRRNAKNIKALIHKLREMKDQGSLETAKVAQIVKSVRALRRAAQDNDRRLIKSSVDELCRLFLKSLEGDNQTEATDD